MEQQSKATLKSVGFWGGILAAIPFLLNQLPDVVAQVLPILPPHIGAIVSAVGGLVAIYGRSRAKGPLKL